MGIGRIKTTTTSGNVYWIKFRSRFCPSSYYDVSNRAARTWEVEHTDDDNVVCRETGAPQTEMEEVVAAYKAAEHADYLRFLANNPRVAEFISERDKSWQLK